MCLKDHPPMSIRLRSEMQKSFNIKNKKQTNKQEKTNKNPNKAPKPTSKTKLKTIPKTNQPITQNHNNFSPYKQPKTSGIKTNILWHF